MPGHPYLVTHDNYGRTFWISRSGASLAPVKLPMPMITSHHPLKIGHRGSRQRAMVRAKPHIIRSLNKTSFRIYLGRVCCR